MLSEESWKKLLETVPALKSDFNMLIMRLKRKQLDSSVGLHATLEFIRSMVSRLTFDTTKQLIGAMQRLGHELLLAAPSELTMGNLVRRVLFFIREEYVIGCKEEEELNTTIPMQRFLSDESIGANRGLSGFPSLNSLISDLSITPGAGATETYDKYPSGLKGAVLAAISELHGELDNFVPICQRVHDFVHADECILTYGYSKVVESFLRAAAGKRRFQLLICESAPGLEGHKLAASMAKLPSVSVALVPDSNIYALMARVHKVIISPTAVMADGSCITPSGQILVASAAKEFSVPVVAITGSCTLTPLFPHNQTLAIQQLLCPGSAVPVDANVDLRNVQVCHPAFDLIPPSHVSLYVTNDGSFLPTYVFRQLSEYYNPSDYNL